MARALVGTTIFLALLGIVASIDHLVASEHYNEGFARYPVTTRIHVSFGALYLALALVQFSPGVRERWPSLHRLSGRLAVLVGMGAGVTALVISALFPYGGRAELAVAGPFAVLFLASLVRGIWLARQRQFAEHREWMIRAMAVGTSISTMRLIFVPSLIALGGAEETARWLSLTSFAIAFVVHSTVAELWIRSTRSEDVGAPTGLPQQA